MNAQLIITTACQPKDVITLSVHMYARYVVLTFLVLQFRNNVILIFNRDGPLVEQDIHLMQRREIATVRNMFQSYILNQIIYF